MDGSPLARLGLERVCWVRLVRHPAGLVAEVGGVVQRRPVVRRIPLAVAADLVASGVPVMTRDERGDRPAEAVPA